jgi:hypothetical protein
MFNGIAYDRFGHNKNRVGFNSIKKVKSKRYMSVKQDATDQTNEEEFTNIIEFDNEEKLETIYEDQPETFEIANEMHVTISNDAPNITHLDHELLKMKTLVKFMDIAKKQKNVKKFEKPIV